MASWLRRVPVRVGNSGSCGAPVCSLSQPRRTATVSGRERGGSFFSAFAYAADVGAAAEGDVGARQADQLGDPQPGLDGQEEHGVVAPAGPGGPIGCC